MSKTTIAGAMRIGELTRTGFHPVPPSGLDALRAHFTAHHYVTLDGLIEPWLLERWAGWIDTAPFRTRQHHDADYWGGAPPPVDEVMEAADVQGRMLFAINDPALFRAIEQVAGCGAVGCYHGSVYRLGASSGDRDRFHTDMNGNRLAALTINLGREPYRGGRVEMIDAASGALLHALENTAFGGALLFELSEDLKHRVGGVEEGPLRTVLTGWFQREPAYADWLAGAHWSG